VLAYFAGREQEVHPPEPERFAHDRPGITVGGLDESRGDPLPTHPLDPYGVEVDPGETELMTGGGDPLKGVDCVRHGHTVASARLRSVVTEVIHAGMYRSEVYLCPRRR